MLERASPWRALLAAAALTLVPIGRIIAAPVLVVVLLGAILLVVSCCFAVARAREMQRNSVERVAHGLEHACIALLKKFGHHPIEGRTKNNTFVVGLRDSERATTAAVWQATQDAIRRIRNGQHDLAYTPRCGTSIMVRGLLTALAVGGGALACLVGGFTVPTVVGSLGAYIAARLLSYPLGLLIQHTMTVSTEFRSARVVNVESTPAKDNKATFLVSLEVIA
ncbi:MAG TPA: DUF6391 domain-containing protein [Kofleriaceae bacterium]|jgi:hypothetical protein